MKVKSKVAKKHNKTDRVYCRIGDELTVIANHVDVLVVENSKGYKFPIHINDVDYDKTTKGISG